ncbi:hypothetical protein [Alteromonas sp. ALT199]|uniref:hypothetical protein n=1 Tax=unclassified Alteromonas TaxID=2614992 RepID=UPI0020371FF9|nr:hypothetical protein [Alteromonas sp. ALT199]
MRDKEKVKWKSITSYTQIFKCKPYFLKAKQQGMAVLAIVAILLSVVTFTTITTSQNVQQYYAIQKVRQDTVSSHSILKNHLKEVATALRTQSVSTALNTSNKPFISTTVHEESLKGAGQQLLTHYEVSVSHNAENIKYKASFLRYPALFRLPTAAQLFSWDNQLTQWLFNRSVPELSAAFFPKSVTASHCYNLVDASVYWINGDCVLAGSDLTHTSSLAPALLIVVDGDLTLSTNTHFFGLIIMLSTTSATHELHLAHSSSIKGAFVSNTQLQKQIYGLLTPSAQVLSNLQASTQMAKIIPVPGTWYDIN